jgi:hypothetical protein
MSYLVFYQDREYDIHPALMLTLYDTPEEAIATLEQCDQSLIYAIYRKGLSVDPLAMVRLWDTAPKTDLFEIYRVVSGKKVRHTFPVFPNYAIRVEGWKFVYSSMPFGLCR